MSLPADCGQEWGRREERQTWRRRPVNTEQTTPLQPLPQGRDLIASVGRPPRTQQHGFRVVKKRRSAHPRPVEGRFTDAGVFFARCLGFARLYCTLLCTLLSAMRRGSGGEGPAAVTVRQRGPILRRVEGLAGPVHSMHPSGRRVDCGTGRFPPHHLTGSFTSCHARQHSAFPVFSNQL